MPFVECCAQSPKIIQNSNIETFFGQRQFYAGVAGGQWMHLTHLSDSALSRHEILTFGAFFIAREEW